MPARVRNVAGEPTRVGGIEITPLTRLVEFQKEKLPVGMRWESPNALRVRYSDGRIESMPIPDPTRNIVVGLFIGTLAALVAGVISSKRRKRSR
jgi:hypothetical protein